MKNIALLCPPIKDLESLDYWVNLIKNPETQNTQGFIIPQGFLVGLMADKQTQSALFYHKQEEFISRLQTILNDDQFIISTLLKEGSYEPLCITKKEVYWLNLGYIVIKDLCVVLDGVFEDIPEEYPRLNVFLKAPPFEWDGQHISSHQMMVDKVSQIQNQNQGFSVYLNLNGAFEQSTWDGVMCYQKQNEPAQLVKASSIVAVVDDSQSWTVQNTPKPEDLTCVDSKVVEQITQAIKTYVENGGFKKVLVGLSGGVDSALVATLSVLALGKERVKAVLMPGPFSSAHSVEDAQALSIALGIDYDIIPITDIYNQYLQTFKSGELENAPFSLMHENIQARIRGNILMAYSNELSALVLNTCNKSEDAVGYSTMYGDAIGGFAPIGDLYKTEVYQIACYINRVKDGVIPKSILLKDPSAELKPDQKDSDTLPLYEQLDAILKLYLDHNEPIFQIAHKLELKEEIVADVIKKVHQSEYKRRQAPPVLYLTKEGKGLRQGFPLIFNNPKKLL